MEGAPKSAKKLSLNTGAFSPCLCVSNIHPQMRVGKMLEILRNLGYGLVKRLLSGTLEQFSYQ